MVHMIQILSVPTVFFDKFDGIIEGGYNAASVNEVDLCLPLREFSCEIFKST